MSLLHGAGDGYARMLVVLHCSEAYLVSTGMIPR